ncbi:MAG: threonylcarbamoyl-AMP synthase [Oscillospiraceae bacterium]|jgi:L-threonylcarbamoyladenylate synthase|nr:threonylcarbamoyl-AMP synthase [Oscillospiraceae bacterium]
METLCLSALGERASRDIALAAEIIRRGGLVAFPTETVYGLGANAFDPAAVERIYAAKGRPQDNPLILHISDYDDIYALCSSVPKEAALLAESFWPGPLTLVLPRSEKVPGIVSAGLDTVAVRLPGHPVARKLIKLAGVPVAAPSANLSGKPSATAAGHVISDFAGRIDAVLDGGDCRVGLESTVVSLVGAKPRLLRPGGVTFEQLTAVLGETEVDRAVTSSVPPDEKVSSPGMKYRHYAPDAGVTVICGAADKTAAYIKAQENSETGIICFDEFSGTYRSGYVISIGRYGDGDDHARKIFDALRRFDSLPVKRIYAQCPPEKGIGLAVSNRLKKAAGFDVIYL